jgi:N-acyl amino acid synthase of PEP-CTERM/exosortase system
VSIDNNNHALYGRYFKVVLADTPTLLHAVYRLRYQVYCVEKGFEDPAAFSNGMENDIYDSDAVHAALIHLATKTVCGCVRLVLPRSGVLPVHNIAIDQEARTYLHKLPVSATAEVSRYAVSKKFRRRVGEADVADVHFSDVSHDDCRRLLPHITVGLIIAVARLSITHGISHLTAVMAPALLRLLRSVGVEFIHLGRTVDHHGIRQPCFATVTELLDGLSRRNPSFYEYVVSQLGTLRVDGTAVLLGEHGHNASMDPAAGLPGSVV